MGYRQVLIKKSDRMKLKNNNLVISNNNKENKIPLEDINFIILEDNRTIISARLLSELGKHFISLIICDEKFEPSTIMYSYNNHYKQLETLNLQLSLNDILRVKLWKDIVKRKINNQILSLEMTTNDFEVINKLKQYEFEVTENDVTNREGLAAKIYFRSIFGSEFIRFYDDEINASLNYGYTIIKSCIVRTLVKYGLNTFLGIKHSSKTNNFNLAYDLIEPYRALIDIYIYRNLEKITYPLSFETRKQLINLLNFEVLVNGMHCTVEYSIELLVKSYITSIEKNDSLLLFPIIINDQ